jgi:rubredoxin
MSVDKYVCMMCGHIYDPAKGETKSFMTVLCNTENMELYECKPDAKPAIPAGTDFSALPAEWRCPVCGYPKSYYHKQVPDTLHAMRTISY